MIPDDELTSIRAELAKALPDSCTIRRATVASDGMGGQTETWADVATVAGRLAPARRTPREQAIAMRLQGSSLWDVYLPVGTDVQETDRLVIDSLTVEVAGVEAPRSWELWRKVICVEVE